jgi:lauroyl/myristoyl acyltransferase
VSSVKSSLVGGAHQLRRLIPASAARKIVRRKVDKLWSNDAYRELQEAQMRHLLEFTERADEVPVLARTYAEEALLKGYLRWHPKLVTSEPVRDVEWLTTKRDPNRSIVLSFMHHYRYEGMFNALKQRGVDIDILATPLYVDKNTPTWFKHHLGIVASGGRMIPAIGGTDKFIEMVKPGMVLAVASDLPGHTEVSFLGRRCRGSFGAARIATLTNSQVVLIRVWRDEDGSSYLKVEPPIEPSDFAGPKELLDEILRRHEEAVLAWPEVLDMPRARFAAIED